MAFEGILESNESFGTQVKDFASNFAAKHVPGYLRHQVTLAVNELANGFPCLFPNETIYTILFDGRRLDLIEKMRQAKGRRVDQREALALPPFELIKYVDFSQIQNLNKEVNKETIPALFEAHPRLGVVFPCVEHKVPSHLITHREVNGKKIPTALGVWNSGYNIFSWLWEAVSRYPHVLLVGSSANITGQPPLNFWETRRKFAPYIPYKLAIRDPRVESHPKRGSYPIIDLVGRQPAVLRLGNLSLEEPIVLEKLKKVLPSLKSF